MIRSLSKHVNLYLSIERATEVGSFCGWYVRGFSGLPKAGSRVAYAFLVYMLPPIPGRTLAQRFSLPRYGSRIGLHTFLFEACSTFTRVAACTLALSPIRDTLIEGFSHFVTSMTAPITSGWSGCRVRLASTGKRRLARRTGHATTDTGIR